MLAPAVVAHEPWDRHADSAHVVGAPPRLEPTEGCEKAVDYSVELGRLRLRPGGQPMLGEDPAVGVGGPGHSSFVPPTSMPKCMLRAFHADGLSERAAWPLVKTRPRLSVGQHRRRPSGDPEKQAQASRACRPGQPAKRHITAVHRLGATSAAPSGRVVAVPGLRADPSTGPSLTCGYVTSSPPQSAESPQERRGPRRRRHASGRRSRATDGCRCRAFRPQWRARVVPAQS